MKKQKKGQESKKNLIRITSGVISYIEWHRNRDRQAKEERNFIVHKKSFVD